jgi:predicted ABC-class ATPase
MKMDPVQNKEFRMRNWKDLEQTLRELDGRGYKGYLGLKGGYEFGGFCLFIDHVQGDPFAAPSRIRIRVPQSEAKIPMELQDNAVRRLAMGDLLIRRVHREILRVAKSGRGMGKSGLISIDVGGQEVLERTAIKVTDTWVEVRMEVGLPAAGRTILGRQAYAMLCEDIPQIIRLGLLWKESLNDEGQRFVDCIENQAHIRSQLSGRQLVAFLADGSVLPRESGNSDRPLQGKNLQVFQSPTSFRVTLTLLHPTYQNGKLVTALTGMGVPEGITLIVGGGYHGKSTLLRALERGVYPHIPGDGREYVVTHSDAVKIRAEDGRRVEAVNISGFITDLPFAQATTQFSTNNASGSTSQAATLLEAVEVGATVLLIDEDTSATNFMVRDARMQRLVKKAQEPITPFVDRVRELYRDLGVSTILVMGGCGDYFDVAGTVIMMQEYQPVNVTEQARSIRKSSPTQKGR